NPAAVEGLMEMAAGMSARRRLGVVTAPGDRRDEDIRAVGRAAARLDYVIVKEDNDRRGREVGAVAALVMEGLSEGGMDPERVEFAPSELAAVARGLEMLVEGDLLVVLADEINAVLGLVRPHASGSGL
ncbi:MAG TPA: cyanophycin synthetase, partial [Longimicrobiaceae bacterium]|nr:cyanophycin synthetase [Longimicrobiaceae bacterium]